MFPRSEILIEREKTKIGGAISCQHLLEHNNRRLILCLGGWSRLDSSTQQLGGVAWSPRRLHLLPTSIGIYFRLKLVLLVLRGWSRLDLSTHSSVELRGAIGGRICCQQLSEHTLRLHLVLERVESPRSRHTAVGLRGAIGGRMCCQQSSEHTNRRPNPVLGKDGVA